MTEVKTQKISEEKQTTTTAGAELTQTIAYIAEREANLAKYSDKLRNAVEKIAVTVSKGTPGMVIMQETPFYVAADETEYFLHFDNDGLYVKKVKFGVNTFLPLVNCSRAAVKAMVPTLPKFLAYVAEKLAEAEKEYKQVAEAAEKMAASLK